MAGVGPFVPELLNISTKRYLRNSKKNSQKIHKKRVEQKAKLETLIIWKWKKVKCFGGAYLWPLFDLCIIRWISCILRFT